MQDTTTNAQGRILLCANCSEDIVWSGSEGRGVDPEILRRMNAEPLWIDCSDLSMPIDDDEIGNRQCCGHDEPFYCVGCETNSHEFTITTHDVEYAYCWIVEFAN